MSAIELDRSALIARLGRRSWPGVAFGVLAGGLILGSLAWVVAGWLGLPRAWIPYCAAATGLFAVLEIGVQRRSRAPLAPVLELLADCVRRLSATDLGHHRGLPWIGGVRDGRPFTVHVEWHGGERLRLGLTVDARLEASLRLVPADADDPPHRWMSRLRTKHHHRDVPDLPPGLLGLSPDPPTAAALWATDPELARRAEALTTRMLPRAAVLDLQPDGVGWDGPLDTEPPLTAEAVEDILTSLIALAERAEAGGAGMAG